MLFSYFYKNITKENIQVYTIVISNHLIVNAQFDEEFSKRLPQMWQWVNKNILQFPSLAYSILLGFADIK